MKISKVNEIIEPYFTMVDDPYNDNPIAPQQYAGLDPHRNLFWKLKNGRHTRLPPRNVLRTDLVNKVKDLNIGEVQLCSLSGLGCYLIITLHMLALDE